MLTCTVGYSVYTVTHSIFANSSPVYAQFCEILEKLKRLEDDSLPKVRDQLYMYM